MKRRRFFKAIAATPLAPSLIAQQTAAPSNAPAPTSPAPPPIDATQPPAPLNRTPTAMAAPVRIETAVADEVAEMAPRYFTPAQFGALRKLSETIMPPMNGAPGALEAGAPEFLDFLISESPQDRQQLYKIGLDQLNAQAKKRFSKTFAELDATQTVTLLAPLREAWAFDPPTDPLARFLREAKKDVRTATINSREYASAVSSSGRRGAGGIGLYWYPLD